MAARASGNDSVSGPVAGRPSPQLGATPIALSGTASDPNGNRLSLMMAGLALMVVAAGSLVVVWRRQRAANSLI